ncbi:MAG: FAD-binding protein [Proteobacteria bacterium]|nr:FAD-binding protein [Pseudomonadota bacterium]
MKEIVRRANNEGKKLRARGSGHSWNDAIATDGFSVDTSRMSPEGDSSQQVTWEKHSENGREYYLMSVPPGLTQGELTKLAQDKGCPFPTQGPAPDITIAGFVANGCHGTGWSEGTIAELVYGIDILIADGTVLHFDVNTVPETLKDLGLSPAQLMDIVRVNLGSLGIITRLTFKLEVDGFNLRVGTDTVTMTDVLDRNDPSKLRRIVEENDYIELFWYPYNNFTFSFFEPYFVPQGPEKDQLLVMAFSRTNDPVSPGSEAAVGLGNLMDLLAPMGAYIGKQIEKNKYIVPSVSSMTVLNWKAKFGLIHNLVIKPRSAFLYQTKYFKDFYDLSFTVPMAGEAGFKDAVDAWYQTVDRMEAWRNDKNRFPYPINLLVHARFVKNSTAVLSPAYQPAGSDTHTCFIEYLSFGAGTLKDHFGDFTGDFFSAEHGGGWKKFGGMPHWGKYLEVVPGLVDYVRSILTASGAGEDQSRLDRFLAVRDRLDPKKLFTNRFIGEILDGEESTRAAGLMSFSVDEAEPADLAKNAGKAGNGAALPQQVFSVDPGRFESAIRDHVRRERDGSQFEMFHDPGSNSGHLVDEYGEVILFGYDYDKNAQQVTYCLLTSSTHLAPQQIFYRIGEFLQ